MEKEHCKHCGVELKWENTSPASQDAGYCHTCYNDMVNEGVLNP